MSQRPSVPVAILPAIIERNLVPHHQLFDRRFGFIAQRPGLETLAPQRQLGRLNADQPHGQPALEIERIAVRNRDHPARRPGLQRIAALGKGRRNARHGHEKCRHEQTSEQIRPLNRATPGRPYFATEPLHPPQCFGFDCWFTVHAIAAKIIIIVRSRAF